MNDPQFVEAGRALAQHALRASDSDVNAELDFMTLRVLARTFTDRERKIVRSGYDDFLAHYRTDPAAATRLLVNSAFASTTSPPA